MLRILKILLLLASLLFGGGLVQAKCPGTDLNGDCRVGVEDLQLFAGQWLDPSGTADFDGLNGVGLVDYAILSASWLVEDKPLVINEFLAKNTEVIQDPEEPGEYPDWIELYNVGESAIDLSGMYLTDDLGDPTEYLIPAGVSIGPGGYLLFWADDDPGQGPRHTNFKLSKTAGSAIGLFDTDGTTLIDSIVYGAQDNDISYGRYPDGYDSWVFFDPPSPGNENNGDHINYIGDVEFSHEHGFYTEPFEVTVTSSTEDATIYYTLNGSEPNEFLVGQGTYLYTAPIPIVGTTAVRAAAFKDGFQPGNIGTQTYIFLDDVINQPADPCMADGTVFPLDWKGNYLQPGEILPSGEVPADYEMDPVVVNDPCYGGMMVESLESLPALSIVMDMCDLFDLETGICSNPTSEGDEWERTASIELIMPEGDDGFNTDTRIRVIGGASRKPYYTNKRSFRFAFRAPYGTAKLKFDVFEDSRVEEFDHIMLRTGANDSFGQNKERAQYTRDEWHRRTGLQMGHVHPHGTWWHFYINGLYWGLCNPVERPNSASFAVSYLGGDPSEWDVIKRDYVAPGGYEVEGDTTAWNAIQAMASAGLSSLPAYEAFKEKFDVDAFIDYLLIEFYGANTDWPQNNWSVIMHDPNLSRVVPGAPPCIDDRMRFLLWDCDYTMGVGGLDIYADKTAPGSTSGPELPTDWHACLLANDEYKMLFADHIQRHFFNDGVLSEEKAAENFLAINSEVESAMVSESARWGDQVTHVGGALVTYDNWLSQQQVLLDDWFPHRTDILLAQLKSYGLYPDVSAPKFFVNGQNQHGGQVFSEDELTIVNPAESGTIYYAIDGSDPRLAGGAVSSNAVEFESESMQVTLITEDASKKAYIPASNVNSAWKSDPYFDDSSWTAGTPVIPGRTGGVGYDVGTAYEPYITYDVQTEMRYVNTTCYVRIPFTVDAGDLNQFNFMKLRIRYNDGFIAYINGVKVAEENAPVLPQWDSKAMQGHSSTAFHEFDVSDFITALQPGDNVLAIHGLADALSDYDFIVSVELVARIPISQDTVQLDRSSIVKSRILDGSEWSALSEAIFAFGPVADDLRITEIMYHPEETGDANDPNEEFIELQNIGDETLDLSYVSFTNGITFTFGDPQFSLGDILLSAGFDSDAEGFIYADDTFNGTGNPGKAAGSYESGGGFTGGGLKVSLGPGPMGSGASGGWSKDFVLDGGTNINLRYRMVMSDGYEEDEFCEAIFEVDGVRYGADDNNSLVHHAGGGGSGLVVVTEASPDNPDYVEIQNVSGTAVDTSGWVVAVNNAQNDDINSVHGVVWDLPASINAGEVLYRTDKSDDNYWGSNIWWTNNKGGWVIILDAAGNVVDFMVWKYSPSEIASLNVMINGFNVTVGSQWVGNSIVCDGGMARAGNSDNDNASDFNTPEGSKGVQNANLVIPFTGGGTGGGGVDTSWCTAEFNVPLSGSNHTLTLGGYSTAVVGSGSTEVFFDDVVISGQSETLGPGGRVVIVRDIDAFETRYGDQINVAGQYIGALSNGGERIRLRDAAGQTILNFRYDDDWQEHTDGEGFSLNIIDANVSDEDSWKWQSSWGASSYVGGTPGATDTGLRLGDVVINEVLAHSDVYPNDWIELHNTTDSGIDIGGWYLSDNDSNLMKYRIPDGTVLTAGGYKVFTQDDHFGNVSDPCCIVSFGLSENGEVACLSSGLDPNNGRLTGFRENEDFGASSNEVAFGRYVKSTGTSNFVAMSQNTPGASFEGAANAYPLVGPIVISELMYNPASGNQNEEYIELYNISDSGVTLYDFAEGEAWKFTDGIEYTFSNNTTIPARGYLMLVKDVNAFNSCYTVPAGTQIWGPYEGQLSNGGEKVELSMPGDLQGSIRYYIRVDRVNYSDGSNHNDFVGRDPWPAETDGVGKSLTRKVMIDYGNDPNNWGAVKPTPGSKSVVFINEFMADNASTIEDPEEPGEYPDWIELYNTSKSAVDIGGMYLTDDLTVPAKWRIPDDVNIGPYGYVFFWADEDDGQGDMHTNFKLDAGGEEIGLFDVDGVTEMDTVVFGSQTTDESYGRFPEGTDNWIFFSEPTPGEPSNMNLEAYWKLDGDANDSAGDHNGTIYGNPVWTPGQIGEGLAFDGDGDYIDVGDRDSLDFGPGDSFSISAWIKTGEYWEAIVSKKRIDAPEDQQGYSFEVHRSGVFFSIWDVGGNYASILGGTEVDDNQWHHVVAVRDTLSDRIYLYLDGNPDGASVIDTTTGTLETNSSCQIGRMEYYTYYFDGVIDDVRIYSRALSDIEIMQQYLQH